MLCKSNLWNRYESFKNILYVYVYVPYVLAFREGIRPAPLNSRGVEVCYQTQLRTGGHRESRWLLYASSNDKFQHKLWHMIPNKGRAQVLVWIFNMFQNIKCFSLRYVMICYTHLPWYFHVFNMYIKTYIRDYIYTLSNQA